MPRQAWLVIPGLPHHIIQRGNNRQRIFFDDDDYLAMLALLRQSSEKTGTRYNAYCLMPNHYHLIGTSPDEKALSAAIGYIQLCYSLRIKERYGYIGHLWQGRFSSFPMDDEYYANALHYVECNPSRAKIVQHPWEYPWSSAQAHITGRDPYRVLDMDSWLQYYTPAEWMEWLNRETDSTFIEQFRQHSVSGALLQAKKKR